MFICEAQDQSEDQSDAFFTTTNSFTQKQLVVPLLRIVVYW